MFHDVTYGFLKSILTMTTFAKDKGFLCVKTASVTPEQLQLDTGLTDVIITRCANRLEVAEAMEHHLGKKGLIILFDFTFEVGCTSHIPATWFRLEN